MAEKISKVKAPITENELAALLMLIALLFGAWLRLMPASLAGFPLNDGGMFYTMIRDLRQNGYALPAYTTYNQLQIPYAYPPLAFYLAGFLADALRVSDLTVLLWLPAVVNLLTLPAFALLAGSMLESRLKTALATFFYALMPLAMDWFLMGGGLTRGLGQLFLLLTAWGAYRLFATHARKYLLTTILSGALVVLCHPESALLTVTTAAILWLFSSRSRRTIFDALLVGAGVVLLCAPWLFYVLRLHGPEPFLKSLQTSGNSMFLWLSIFPFNFTQETGLALLAALGLIGLFFKLGKKEYLLPAWVVIPFFINPRSSARAAIIPLAMLAAISLLEVILPALQGPPDPQKPSRGLAGKLFAGYILVYLLLNGYGLDLRMTDNRLSEADQQAMAWIRQNTPADSQFIVLTSENQMMRDPIQEWFPALTERNSQTTLQGREWLWGEKFIQAIGTYPGLKTCLGQDLSCLDEQTRKLGLSYDTLYLQKENARGLLNSLKQTAAERIIYENEAVILFTTRP
jgi:hypothetical protein